MSETFSTSTSQEILPSEHFLNLPRPDVFIGPGASADNGPDFGGIVDTTTLAAHDFDVDTRTGFMPPDPPIHRLPEQWEPWEAVLKEAMRKGLQLAIGEDVTDEERKTSDSWRSEVSNLPTLAIQDLTTSEVLLRRAHHVLTFIMHFYIHTLPLTAPVVIPASIGIPLLRVSRHLQLPPIATYSDTVLYNWELKKAPSTCEAETGLEWACTMDLDNLKSQDLFTGTRDEEEFFLASARIELRGVEALELMRASMDEMFVGDDIAVRRITSYLSRLAGVIHALTGLLMDVRKGCDPDVFYHRVRPWFCGQDADPAKRTWKFEGIEKCEDGMEEPTDLSGPSAGQSALIHALDIFLGLDNCRSETTPTSGNADARTLLRRMQIYMPRHHRAFLRHLSANPRPMRDFAQTKIPELVDAYNRAVGAVKEFRDAHIRIVALYIVGPATRGRAGEAERGSLKGTGGTQLVQFLKGVRDKTEDALLQ
ncbi:Indoleamine 2,3-dioxygenase [Pisolithus orientalis]|uniref:Indoleamine 2,3-dioxygenase n=1 Tax=Pisolithus orientalis TaxID=936130 RepID=UPI00222544D4|nr:Indoleamine 2,3-dioxygenase [Pisolithus orientalis]KAI6006205.1 Indoleamine 2,3-dioxygenase [Pisolithus orientalis]